MTRKRDLVSEIRDVNSRLLARTSRMKQFHRRYAALTSAADFLVRHQLSSTRAARRELARYIPVGVVASLEGYFRMAVRDLVDSGEPYVSNARKLYERPVDFGILLGINVKAITLGELVSHVLSYSTLEDINQHMSAIIGKDFLSAVKAFKFFDGDEEPFLDSFPFIMPSLPKMYQLRHVYAHELAPKASPSFHEITGYPLHTYLFVAVAETLLQGLQQPQKGRAALLG